MKIIIPTLMVFALLMFGCGGGNDNKEPDSDGGEQIDEGGVANRDSGASGGTGGSSGGTGGSGGTSPMDSGTAGSGGPSDEDGGDSDADVDPEMDGGEMGDGSVGDGSTAADADQEDADTDPIDLPDPGEPLSTCTANEDCTVTTDDLTCYRAAGESVGYCTEDCIRDTNCSAIGGLTTTCANGACVVECENADDTNCPENMQCLPTRPGTDIPFICSYSEDIVQPSQQLFEICSFDAQCAEDLICFRPGQMSGSTGNSYCTNECTQVDDCEMPDGVTVEMDCSPTDRCRILCDETADCPDGMECQQIPGGGGGGGQRGCWYP